MFERAGCLVVVLADGAGGTRGGAEAATAVVEAVRVRDPSDLDFGELLVDLDGDPRRLGLGQTTAIALSISLDRAEIRGASVGDSGAWVVRGGEIDDLTSAQARKPLVGDGASPMPFRGTLDGTLVVASDGLLRYASAAAIAAIASGPDLAAAAQQLVELVRLPSGELQDDVAVVLVR